MASLLKIWELKRKKEKDANKKYYKGLLFGAALGYFALRGVMGEPLLSSAILGELLIIFFVVYLIGSIFEGVV
jgi:hypothetical protein